MERILDVLYRLLWGMPTVFLLLVSGAILTIRSDFAQIRLLPNAFRSFRSHDIRSGGISPFRSLCIALSATIGTGNLVGVAGAVCLGGPGAVFWILVCGFFGMAVKYAEAVLAVRYQSSDGGELVGGTMHIIRNGLGKNWAPMGYLYCLFGIAASFGVGNLVQINTITSVLCSASASISAHLWCLGVVLMILVGLSFWRGADSVGRISEWLIPAAAGAYVLFCILFLIFRAQNILPALQSILRGAFSPKAVTGGMIGSSFRTMRVGCSRGVFSNEAGMGTASMAHGSSSVDHPVQQGMIGILEVFLDTFIVCLLTALVILTSGLPLSYGADADPHLTAFAFRTVYGPAGSVLVAAVICLFAFSTVLGWSIYGLRCTQFLFGAKAAPIFFLLQTMAVMFGTVLKSPQVWRLAEILNGLMIFPTLTALLKLTPELSRLTKEYRK